MKARTLAVLVCTLFLVASVVSPAMGGPSLRSIAKTAKKALKVAKGADKRARTAQRDINDGTPTRQVNSGDVYAPPLDFARFDVRCPSGYVPSGMGAGYGALDPVFEGPTANGYIASMGNPSNTTSYKGNIYVICIWGFNASSSKSQVNARRDMRRAEQQFLARR
jgi:hypothetical protein